MSTPIIIGIVVLLGGFVGVFLYLQAQKRKEEEERKRREEEERKRKEEEAKKKQPGKIGKAAGAVIAAANKVFWGKKKWGF